MSPEERAELLDALIEGSVTEADMLRLEAELSVDANVRIEYYRRIQLDMMLENEASESGCLQKLATIDQPDEAEVLDANAPRASVALQDASRSGVASRSRTLMSFAKPGMMLAGAAVGIAACVAIFLAISPSEVAEETGQPIAGFSSKSQPPTASGYAVVSGRSEAVWDGETLREGDLVPNGLHHLVSGTVHIELFSGVQMVIEGDARFSIDSQMQVTMQSGRARTRVPEPAQGFRIKTASGEVIDLGTEFSIDVREDSTDVHVVEGAVELLPLSGESEEKPRTKVGEGSTLRLSQIGGISDAEAVRPLIGPREFHDLQAKKQVERMRLWESAQSEMQADKRLVAHYRYSNEFVRSRQLRNLARKAEDRASDGAVVAARQTIDRWGRSGSALDFSRMGSSVRLSVPGEHRGITMLCWVKINSLDRWFNSLFLTDGHEDLEPHWQIMDDGRIFFSVKLPSKDGKKLKHEYYSPEMWTASLSGRWMMLGVSYDVDNRRVTHYLNGRSLSQEAIPEEHLVDSIHIGPASICNWSDPMYRTDASWVVRNLNGSMDEFMLFSGALSGDEVLKLYRLGDPNEN